MATDTPQCVNLDSGEGHPTARTGAPVSCDGRHSLS